MCVCRCVCLYFSSNILALYDKTEGVLNGSRMFSDDFCSHFWNWCVYFEKST